MGKIWFSSDIHFCHDRDFIYEPRGFNSVQENNEVILEHFNKVVSWDDDLYLLGDNFLNDNHEGMKYLQRIPGRLHFIWGNHDTDTRQLLIASMDRADILGYANIFKYDKYHFYLSHYPTLTDNYDSKKPLSHRLIDLYGHTHQKTNHEEGQPYTMYHVGVDSHNCYPVNIEEIIGEIQEYIKKEK